MKSIGAFLFLCATTLVASESTSSNNPSVSAWNLKDYESQCEVVKSKIITKALKQVEELRGQVLEGKCISTFGIISDKLCNESLEDFSRNAPEPGDDMSASSTYDQKLEELESSLDTPLQMIYLRQLALIRDRALNRYRSAAKTSDASDYEAMLNSDTQFVQEAEEATREGSDWDYAQERTHLQNIMSDLASSGKRVTDIQLKSSQQQSTAMQYLQQQQQMIQQLQMQLYGQTSPWNVGVAYRIPDTNFNLQGSYQQGRTNVQLSCVPDEYAPLLGPNGFTSGVGPGNLGLSLNLSV